jgi:hypothetical protein
MPLSSQKPPSSTLEVSKASTSGKGIKKSGKSKSKKVKSPKKVDPSASSNSGAAPPPMSVAGPASSDTSTASAAKKARTSDSAVSTYRIFEGGVPYVEGTLAVAERIPSRRDRQRMRESHDFSEADAFEQRLKYCYGENYLDRYAEFLNSGGSGNPPSPVHSNPHSPSNVNPLNDIPDDFDGYSSDNSQRLSKTFDPSKTTLAAPETPATPPVDTEPPLAAVDKPTVATNPDPVEAHPLPAATETEVSPASTDQQDPLAAAGTEISPVESKDLPAATETEVSPASTDQQDPLAAAGTENSPAESKDLPVATETEKPPAEDESLPAATETEISPVESKDLPAATETEISPVESKDLPAATETEISPVESKDLPAATETEKPPAPAEDIESPVNSNGVIGSSTSEMLSAADGLIMMRNVEPDPIYPTLYAMSPIRGRDSTFPVPNITIAPVKYGDIGFVVGNFSPVIFDALLPDMNFISTRVGTEERHIKNDIPYSWKDLLDKHSDHLGFLFRNELTGNADKCREYICDLVEEGIFDPHDSDFMMKVSNRVRTIAPIQYGFSEIAVLMQKSHFKTGDRKQKLNISVAMFKVADPDIIKASLGLTSYDFPPLLYAPLNLTRCTVVTKRGQVCNIGVVVLHHHDVPYYGRIVFNESIPKDVSSESSFSEMKQWCARLSYAREDMSNLQLWINNQEKHNSDLRAQTLQVGLSCNWKIPHV